MSLPNPVKMRATPKTHQQEMSLELSRGRASAQSPALNVGVPLRGRLTRRELCGNQAGLLQGSTLPQPLTMRPSPLWPHHLRQCLPYTGTGSKEGRQRAPGSHSCCGTTVLQILQVEHCGCEQGGRGRRLSRRARASPEGTLTMVRSMVCR